ncbi:hypothetical protein ABQE62_05475 [Mycolicibacterium fortuitum]
MSYLSDTELILVFLAVLFLICCVWFIGWPIYQMIQSQIWENRLEAENLRAKREAEIAAPANVANTSPTSGRSNLRRRT